MSYSLLRWSRFLWFLCKIMWICPVPSKAHLIHIPIFLIKALIFASTPIISHITPWDPTLLLPKNSGQSYEWVSIWPMNWGAKELQIEFLNRMIASIASTTCSYSPIMLRNLMWDMSRIEVVFKSIAVFFDITTIPRFWVRSARSALRKCFLPPISPRSQSNTVVQRWHKQDHLITSMQLASWSPG